MDQSLRLRSRLQFVRSGCIQGDHYRIPGVSRRIAYTYIRKNACSAFKSLILRDIQSYPQYSGLTDIMQMSRIARLRSLKAFSASECRIFVYRHPVERIASLYLNKFVQQEQCQDLFRRYARDVKQDPQEASFEDFVTRYIDRWTWFGLDPHVLPQFLHLAPVPYTHAIHVKALHGQMKALVGTEYADSYFKRPRNSTRHFATYSDPEAATKTARRLYQIFASEGAVPTVASLLPDALRAKLEALYRCDFEMLEAIRRQAPHAAAE